MFNEILGLCFVLLTFLLMLAMYKFFGRTGLVAWVAIAAILANVQVTKTVEVFGLTATLGNSLYASVFLATDILNEKYGRKEAQKAVWVGFSSLFVMVIAMQSALLFTPAPSDVAQEPLSVIFGLIPQIAIGSLVAYTISQLIDVHIFNFFRKRYPKDTQFWIRNNGSTMISQLIDTIIFTSIAFYGAFPFHIWFQIFLSTYVLKFIIAALDTPFGYYAKKIRPFDEKQVK